MGKAPIGVRARLFRALGVLLFFVVFGYILTGSCCSRLSAGGGFGHFSCFFSKFRNCRRQLMILFFCTRGSRVLFSPFSTLCKVLEEESVEVEARRKGLEEAREVGRQELDAGREELRLAAEGLEGEKEDIKAAQKVYILCADSFCRLQPFSAITPGMVYVIDLSHWTKASCLGMCSWFAHGSTWVAMGRGWGGTMTMGMVTVRLKSSVFAVYVYKSMR